MQRFFAICALALTVLMTANGAFAEDKLPHPDDHQHYDDHRPFGGGEDNYQYFLRVSDEAFHVGDYERAIACHRAIIALEPDAVSAYGVAAWLLWSLEKGDDATALIERGVAANPDDWLMMNEAAQHFDLRKMTKRATSLYKRSLELLPADESSQMLRRRYAHASEKSGDLATSVNVWRGLVKDYPDEVVNKNNLNRVEQLVADAKK